MQWIAGETERFLQCEFWSTTRSWNKREDKRNDKQIGSKLKL